MLLALLAPAPRPLTAPANVMRGSLALAKLALSFSEKPSLAARFAIVSAWLTTSPTWTLPNAIGASVLASASRYAAAFARESERHDLAARVVEVVDDRDRLARQRRQRCRPRRP